MAADKHEFITVEVSSETRRRLAKCGFPYDLELKDVARFLIEQGLTILERRERPTAA
jgi:hypothetical protein